MTGGDEAAGGDDVNGALAACAAGVARGPLSVNDGAIEGMLDGAGGDVVDAGWMLLMLRTAVTGSGEVCEGAEVGGDVGGDVGAPVGPFGSVSGMQRQH